MAGQKGNKAKHRRSSKKANYYKVQEYRTMQNKIRKRKRWLKKRARLDDKKRQEMLAFNRIERYLASRKRRGVDKPKPVKAEDIKPVAVAAA